MVIIVIHKLYYICSSTREMRGASDWDITYVGNGRQNNKYKAEGEVKDVGLT